MVPPTSRIGHCRLLRNPESRWSIRLEMGGWAPYLPWQGTNMTENSILQVGDTVPDFSLTTYEPTTKGFGEYKLSEAMKNGKWTMLFFYPADYTFV